MYQILIAEDEPRIVAFMQKGLQRAGFATEATHDGETALEMARTRSFDLILLDLGLPRKDGQTILKELRAQGLKLPVIILTARSIDDPDVVPILSLANQFMKKPFRMSDLVKTIRQILPNGK